jgi:hypothetical protein
MWRVRAWQPQRRYRSANAIATATGGNGGRSDIFEAGFTSPSIAGTAGNASVAPSATTQGSVANPTVASRRCCECMTAIRCVSDCGSSASPASTIAPGPRSADVRFYADTVAEAWRAAPRYRAVAVSGTSSTRAIRGRCYCVRNLYATIRATMLAKISSAGRDFRIIGIVEWRAADRPG